ncbi:MAG: asparagine synthase-related protein [Smithellaceae bacterium]|nr:asparagine synthase-related protein [Smithellaceae bacterium]
MRFDRFCEVGGYRLALQGQCPDACAGGLGTLLDGRIFNTAELVGQLGTPLPGGPELLLQAYRKWGTGFARYLQGEFAFVLWDGAAGRILLGCSPGVSLPLFYTQRDEDFFFARSLRHLLTEMGTIPRIDEDYLALWLGMTSLVGNDRTFFEKVYRVLPGSVLVFERGRIKRDLYWQPGNISQLYLKDPREYADGLREVLQQAIRDRLPDHGAVGSLLSGGLDSSTVTSLVAEILHGQGRRLHAFTAVPKYPVEDLAGRFCDEGPAAASVAAMWPNVEHVPVRHGRHSVFSLMDLFGAELMEPLINPANYDWFYESCLQAKERQLDKLFTGDSGNTTISYGDTLLLRSLVSEGRWMALARMAQQMHRRGRHRWRSLAYEIFAPLIPLEIRHILISSKFHSLFEYSMIRREFARNHDLDSMTLERNIEYSHSRPLRIRFLSRPDVDAVSDAFRRLTDVSKVDPAGDRRVIEFCLAVPVEHYCEKGVSRSLIRNAMIGRLPEQVRTEQRRGLQAADFTIHFEREREEALAELARMKKVDLVAQALDLEKLEQLLQWSSDQIAAHRGMAGYWPKILRAFSVGRFLRRYEDGTLFSLPAPKVETASLRQQLPESALRSGS